MLNTFLREITTQSKTALSFGTRLIVFRGLKTLSSLRDLSFWPVGVPLMKIHDIIRRYLSYGFESENPFKGKNNGSLRDGVVKRNKSTWDNCNVHKVPEVPEVRPWVENKSKVQHFKGALEGKNGSETIVGISQKQVSWRVLIDRIFWG